MELQDSQQNNLAVERTRQIVSAHGWNSTAYQILNPGIRRWFSESDDAVTGYVTTRRAWVVVGAPVCTIERLEEVVAEFETEAAHDNKRVCYFCAEARLESVFTNSTTHAKVLLGAQPVWNPQNWAERVSENRSLRKQLNRACNKNVIVTEWSAEQAFASAELLNCLHDWLRAKGLPPMHFMVEPETLSRLFDRRVFVAERDGAVVGFVMLSPVPMRNGWLFEQYVHSPDSPNGTVELMIDAAMRALSNGQSEYATLGLSPLSNRSEIEPFKNPVWLSLLLTWIRAHGRRFYNFEGLDTFKAKFRPERWEPVFAISNEPRLSPGTLYAITSAFSGNAPIRLFLGGLRRAASTEICWLIRKL
ncbi:MAG: DUF2156 domain-containing protein [Chloracidobacterium sp.]|nr:DUF2156 domain-containing protein [Chloracidobacterium sp.]